MLNLKAYINTLNAALLDGSDQTDIEIMLQKVMAELHKVQQQMVPYQNHMKVLLQNEINELKQFPRHDTDRPKDKNRKSLLKQALQMQRTEEDKIKDAIISIEKVMEDLEYLFNNQPQFEEIEINEGSLSKLIDQIKMERYFTQKSINMENTWILDYSDNILALQRQLNIIMKLLDQKNVKQFEPLKLTNLKVPLVEQKIEKEVCINCNMF